jgi:hypothetical protein
MADYVIAIYEIDCYMGEEMLKLVKVFCNVSEAKKHLDENPNHIAKAKKLSDI